MKKYCLSLHLKILLLFISFSSFGQVTNAISDLKVNNVTATQINFVSGSTVNVTFKVKLQTFDGNSDNILGNLFIYTKSASSALEIQKDFFGVVFTVTHPPFVAQTTYNSEILFTVSLTASAFYANGGVLYAEYKNNNNQKYKSSEIPIIGGTAQANPGASGEYLKITTVKYVDTDLPLVDSKIHIASGNEALKLKINYERRLNTGQSCSGYYRLIIRNGSGAITYKEDLKLIPGSSCVSDGNPTTGMFIVNLAASQFVEGKSIGLEFDNVSNYKVWPSPSINVEVVRFTARNSISAQSEVSQEDFINFVSIGVDVVTGVIFDPRSNRFVDVITAVDNFKWYKRTIGGEWALLSEEVVPAPFKINSSTEFFKRAFYKGAYVDSNIAIIIFQPISSLNTICCDQSYTPNVPLSPIIGNAPNVQISAFMWEQGGARGWSRILGATGKNYTPQVTFSGRGDAISFRRVVRLITGELTYSNIIIVYNGPIPSGRYAVEDNISEITIYPNPASTSVTINGVDNQNTIKLFDMSGREISVKQNSDVQNSVSLDISNLPNGIYLLNVEISGNIETKRIIKN